MSWAVLCLTVTTALYLLKCTTGHRTPRVTLPYVTAMCDTTNLTFHCFRLNNLNFRLPKYPIVTIIWILFAVQVDSWVSSKSCGSWAAIYSSRFAVAGTVAMKRAFGQLQRVLEGLCQQHSVNRQESHRRTVGTTNSDRRILQRTDVDSTETMRGSGEQQIRVLFMEENQFEQLKSHCFLICHASLWDSLRVA